jgi:type II secretory pathway pseudopilin PulG
LEYKSTSQTARRPSEGAGEEGYALVAVLALMTILAIAALAAVPNIRMQEQREREQESIFRGEQVAEAIKAFIERSPTHQPPTSMDQLLEGIPVGSKKVQVLRASAAHDPLSKSGEWKLVMVNSPAIINFQTAVVLYAGKPVLPARAGSNLARFAPPMQAPGIQGLDGDKQASTSIGIEDTDETATGPFIGVASKSHRESMISYYGIDHHNEWVFTPLFRP